MSIGEDIKRIRKEKGFTQKQLGELCDPKIDEANIRKYENNKQSPKIETLLKLAKQLNATVAVSKDGELALFSNEVQGFDTTEEFEKEWKRLTEQEGGESYKVIHSGNISKLLEKKINLLNKKGKVKTLVYVEDLIKISEYQKKDE